MQTVPPPPVDWGKQDKVIEAIKAMKLKAIIALKLKAMKLKAIDSYTAMKAMKLKAIKAMKLKAMKLEAIKAMKLIIKLLKL